MRIIQKIKKYFSVRTKAKNGSESGRGMVEMLGVLAIMGILTIGALVGYNYAMKVYHVNEIVEEMNRQAVLASAAKAVGVDLPEDDWNTSAAGFEIEYSPVYEEDGIVYDNFFVISIKNVPDDLVEMLVQKGGEKAYQILINGIPIDEYDFENHRRKEQAFLNGVSLTKVAYAGLGNVIGFVFGSDGEATSEPCDYECRGDVIWESCPWPKDGGTKVEHGIEDCAKNGAHCEDIGNGPHCKCDDVCSLGERECEGNIAKHCVKGRADGFGNECTRWGETDCSSLPEGKCEDGKCKSTECEPGTQRCNSNIDYPESIEGCSENGTWGGLVVGRCDWQCQNCVDGNGTATCKDKSDSEIAARNLTPCYCFPDTCRCRDYALEHVDECCETLCGGKECCGDGSCKPEPPDCCPEEQNPPNSGCCPEANNYDECLCNYEGRGEWCPDCE